MVVGFCVSEIVPISCCAIIFCLTSGDSVFSYSNRNTSLLLDLYAAGFNPAIVNDYACEFLSLACFAWGRLLIKGLSELLLGHFSDILIFWKIFKVNKAQTQTF